MRSILMFIVAAVSLSCAHKTSPEVLIPQLTLHPTIDQSRVNAQLSKASSTDFSVGDEVGVFGILSGQELRASQNRINNCHFVVKQSSLLVGDPAVYFPDHKSPVTLFAYYPYAAAVNDATKFDFAVSDNQNATGNLAQSDLCYARQETMPGVEATKLSFTHKFARVLINIVSNPKVSIDKVELLGAAYKVTLNLADGTTIATADRHTIQALLNASENTAELIVPAQEFAAAEAMIQITTTDSKIYTYHPASKTTLTPSATNTFTLALGQSNTATLTTAQTITDWTTSTSTGSVTNKVKNSFTAHWLLPHKDYQSVDRVGLLVKSTTTGAEKEYSCTAKRTTTKDQAACSYTFDFDPTDMMDYPYSITAINFYADQTLVQRCASLVSTLIYKSGAYTIGVRQDNIVNIVTGTIADWGDMSLNGEVSGGGVNNVFRLQMIDASYAYTTVSRVDLTIDGSDYRFDGLTLEDGSTQFLATSSTFSFPAAAGKIPPAYPYRISQVTLYNGTNQLLERKHSTIDVGRGGMISLQVYRGGVIAIGGSLTSWGSTDGSGVIIGGGTKNKFTLSVIEPLFKLSDVSAIRLTSDTKKYLFNKVKFTATSNEFLATSDVFSTPDAAGAFPARYPFSVTRVDILNSAGLMLQSSVGAVEVFDTRDVSLRIFKSNLALSNTTSTGSWTGDVSQGDVNYGGDLGINPVTLYYSDGAATSSKSCTSATRMTLTIGGKEVSLTIEMQGNGSSAHTKTAVDISKATPAGNLPARYPYSITAITLSNASGETLIAKTFDTAIAVGGGGSVVLRVIR